MLLLEASGAEIILTGLCIELCPFLSSPHSLPAMINLVDAYAIGFSVLSFYFLKKYLDVRGIWKRYGRVASTYFSCRIGLAKLSSPVI